MRRWVPAVVTAAFVMSGFIKETGFLARLPFDLTLGLALLTASLIGARLVLSGVPREAHGVVLAFTLLIPPVVWSAPTEYGSDKVLRLFAFTFLATLAPVVLVRDAGDVARHLWAFTGVTSIVVVNALIDPQLSSDYEGAPITTDSVDTIGLGSAAGHVMVVLTLGLIWNAIPRLAVVAVAPAVYVLLQSGSRGPLLSAVAAVLVGSLLTRVRPDYRRVVAFVGLLAVGVVLAYQAAPLYSQRRILALFEGDTRGSVDGRIRLYDQALESISRNPFGLGWGGFESVAFGSYTYPHNLPLEVLVEAGLVFGGLFLAWLFLRIFQAHRLTVDYVGAAVFAVVLFWLGKAWVSSDLNDNRVVLYALGIAIAAGRVGTSGNVGTVAPGGHDSFVRNGQPILAAPDHTDRSPGETVGRRSAVPREGTVGACERRAAPLPVGDKLG